MSSDRLALSESIDHDAAEAVVRECLVVLGIAVLTGLALLIPGSGREIPVVAIPVADVIVAAGTAAIVGSLLHAVPRVRTLVSSTIDGPETVIDDVGAIAGHLVAFGAVLVAYRGLAPAVVPLLDDAPWAYDQAFFLFGVVVLALIAHRLYRSLDPIAGALTGAFFEVTGYEHSGVDAQQ